MVYLVKLSVTQTRQGQLIGLSVNNEFKGYVQKQLSLIWHTIPAFALMNSGKPQQQSQFCGQNWKQEPPYYKSEMLKLAHKDPESSAQFPYKHVLYFWHAVWFVELHKNLT